ncbi:MAG: hypothetical protein JW956_00870 [Calditrichaceae bacterium]|nr:hypothetical protein [Calditrichaceae bacterium]
MSKADIEKSINEIFKLYKERFVLQAFTLESINNIFDIGNEVFMKNNPEEVEKLSKRSPSKAPDLLDDEPFSFERTFEIYRRLENDYNEINPELIQKVFEVNSQLAWDNYRNKYEKYILDMKQEHRNDEYLNYLASVVLYDHKKFTEGLKCINIAIASNSSSSSYTHLKGLFLMQLGEYDSARTLLYQALFLVELMQDVPPQKQKNVDIYPNYPVEFHTSAEKIRTDLKKIDHIDNLFNYELLPLIN